MRKGGRVRVRRGKGKKGRSEEAREGERGKWSEGRGGGERKEERRR